MDRKDIRVMAKLYWQQKNIVKVGEKVSDWNNIEKGVRQSCVLFPDLFSLYTQVVMEKLTKYEGVKVGNKMLTTYTTQMT